MRIKSPTTHPSGVWLLWGVIGLEVSLGLIYLWGIVVRGKNCSILYPNLSLFLVE